MGGNQSACGGRPDLAPAYSYDTDGVPNFPFPDLKYFDADEQRDLTKTFAKLVGLHGDASGKVSTPDLIVHFAPKLKDCPAILTDVVIPNMCAHKWGWEEYRDTFVKICKTKPWERVAFIYSLLLPGGAEDIPNSTVVDLIEALAWLAFRISRHVGAIPDASHRRSVAAGMAVVHAPSSSRTHVTRDQFINFVLKSAHRLLAPLELWFVLSFLGRPVHFSRSEPLYVLEPLIWPSVWHGERGDSLTALDLWALISFLPPPLELAHRHPERQAPIECLFDVLAHYAVPVIQTPYRPLYSASDHVQSIHKLQHAVDGYAGPTIFLVRTKSDEVFGALVSIPWKTSGKFFGDSDCALFTLRPTFQILPASSNDADCLVSLNPKSDKRVTSDIGECGVSFGGSISRPRLWIDSYMEKGTCTDICRSYRPGTICTQSEFEVATIEVWGCGDEESYLRQEQFRGNITNEQMRRRRIDRTAFLGEDWKTNPDRTLLSLAGVGAIDEAGTARMAAEAEAAEEAGAEEVE